jgi:hypothetical protein
MNAIYVVRKGKEVVGYCDSMEAARSFCQSQRGLCQIDKYPINRKIVHPMQTVYSRDQIIAGKSVPAFTIAI